MQKASSLEKIKRLTIAHKYCQQELPPLPFNVRKPTCLKSNRYMKAGHWTQKEKIKLCIFMDYHKEFFSNKENRRVFKIFKCMAQFMKTRNANQCRSHHQKMEQQYLDPQIFIASIMKLKGRQEYEKHYNMYVKELQSLDKQMGMDKLEEQDDVLILCPPKIEEKIEEKNHMTIQKQEMDLNKKSNQELPTMNTYQTYNQYGNFSLNSGMGDLNNSKLISNKTDLSNNFASMFKTSFNGTNLNSQKMEGMFMNYPMSNPFMNQMLFNYNDQEVKRMKQKEKTLQDCNYYWNKYMKSLLKLQNLTQQRDRNIMSTSQPINQFNQLNLHFLLRPE